MTTFKCPFTNKEIKGLALGNYIRYNYKKFNLDKKEFRFQLYKNSLTPVLCNMESLKELYINKLYSIPDFKKEFHINSTNLFFLLDYFNIQKRNIKDASNLISKVKYKKIIKERYNVENASQLDWVKKKKEETFKKNYGVDNIWKHKDYHKWSEDWYLQKYNLTRSEVVSLSSKKSWLSKTPEEKEKWLLDSIHSKKAYFNLHCQPHKGYNTSKLEDIICLSLNKLLIPYQHPFCKIITTKRRYFYDFLLKEFNTIIEVNGDYWHANPLLYAETDLIHYKFNNITAGDIWRKDKIKLDYVRNLGYSAIQIWESEIKNKTEEQLQTLLKEKLNL